MSEFASSSTYTKNISKEIMILLVAFGLDINFINKNGVTPLMKGIT
jgi:hypothetical protein